MGGRRWKEEVAWEGVDRNKREPGREEAGKREGLLGRRWEEERTWEGVGRKKRGPRRKKAGERESLERHSCFTYPE